MDSTDVAATRPPNFKLPINALLIGGSLVAALWLFWPEEGQPALLHFLTAGAVVLSTLIISVWWLFFSRRSWSTRLRTAAAVVGVVAAFFTVFRPEFTGDIVPILHYRFAPRPHAALPPPVDRKTEDLPNVDVGPLDLPTFRGDNFAGVIAPFDLNTDWSQQPPRLLWKHPCGGGYASFCVVGDLAITLEQRDANEVVIAYGVSNGLEVWRQQYPAAFFETLGGPGPRATPTFHAGRVYSLGATGQLLCLDAQTGRIIWSVDILQDNQATNVSWGMCGSPLIVEEKVVVNPGGLKGAGLAAYDAETGQKIWTGGDHRAGYSCPSIARLLGDLTILLFDGDGLAGHDPSTGRERWRVEWITAQGINVAQPIVLDDCHLFLSTGYAVGCGMVEVRKAGEAWSAEVTQRSNALKAKFSSAVRFDDRIVGYNEGILASVDAKTLQRQWQSIRAGHGQMLRIDRYLLASTEFGEIFLVEPTPRKAIERGRFKVLETVKSWNAPAVAQGKLFVRSHEQMACFDLTNTAD